MEKTVRFNNNLRVERKTGRHLESITTLIRAVEFLLFLAVIAKISLIFPFNHFRQFAVSVFNPLFVFVIGNAIVVILLLRSGGKLFLSNETPDPKAETTFTVESSVAKLSPVKMNCHRRTKSELGKRKLGSGKPVLRRTKTGTEEKRVNLPSDRLSGPEFRRTVEDFIARQQKLLKQEEEEEDANILF